MIGKYIKKKRNELNISQKELANKLNISIQRLNNFENETRIPPLDILGDLSFYLNFDIDDFNKNHNSNLKYDFNLFKDNIKKYRIKNKLTLNDLSTKIQVTRQTISKWEKGQSQPNIDLYYEICRTLNISPSSLICKKVSSKNINIKIFSIIFLLIAVAIGTIIIIKDNHDKTSPTYNFENNLISTSTISFIYKSESNYNNCDRLKNNDEKRKNTIFFNDSNIENIKFYSKEKLILPFYFGESNYIDHYLLNGQPVPRIIELNYSQDIYLTPVYINYSDYEENLKYSYEDNSLTIKSIMKECTMLIVPASIKNIDSFIIKDFPDNITTLITNESYLKIDGSNISHVPNLMFINSKDIQINYFDKTQKYNFDIVSINQFQNYKESQEFIPYSFIHYLYVISNNNYSNFIYFNDNIQYLYLVGNAKYYRNTFILHYDCSLGPTSYYLRLEKKKRKKNIDVKKRLTKY